jgi:hypothetical protein
MGKIALNIFILIFVVLLTSCDNFEFTKLDAVLYNNKLMQLQKNCDSAKLELKSAINSMNKDSIERTYNRFVNTIESNYNAWQEIVPEKDDARLYAAAGACILMYQRNIKVYYTDVIYFYTHTLPTRITERSIEIRGKMQMAQVTEENAFQYLIKQQNEYLIKYKISEP